MGKLYLDTANIDEIKRLTRTTAISGVTTNPSLMAKEEKGDYVGKLKEIAEETIGMHLSVEVITLEPREMVKQAIELRDELKDVDLFVKIPVTLDNLTVISHLEVNEKIKVNATACMTADQAKMAMDAGASVVSFFYNRMKDGKLDADDELRRFANFRTNKNYVYESKMMFGATRCYSIYDIPMPKVICGSIRKPEDITACWAAGADIVTASMKTIEQLISHPQTDKAIQGFQEDIEKWLA